MSELLLNIGAVFVGTLVGGVSMLSLNKKNSKADGLKKEKKAKELIEKAEEESKKIKEETVSHVEKRKESIKQYNCRKKFSF